MSDNGKLYTVGELAEQAGCEPVFISNLLYKRRRLDQNRCVQVVGRWLIPESYRAEALAVIKKALKRRAENLRKILAREKS